MNLTNTLRPTRARRTTFGLILASVVLGGTLTACGGSEAENTTCGELKGMSADETLDFIKKAADDDGSDDAKDAIKAIDSIGDDETAKKTFADTIKTSICDNKDDDTKLKDTPLYKD
ncbi:hypothetical protein [Nocardioides plantarum]|uniref:Lipoprotein n=1 Tax=Nocardioides plantarum TaxID=29299 RepID=A0ABV5K7Y1_9ACTN|nr:hypothetical protein [Nocardioides plantarum]